MCFYVSKNKKKTSNRIPLGTSTDIYYIHSYPMINIASASNVVAALKVKALPNQVCFSAPAPQESCFVKQD